MKFVIGALFATLAWSEGAPSVSPRTVTWEEMSKDLFRPEWILPEGLPLETEEGSGPAWDLTVRMPELARLVVPPSEKDPTAPRCLGDMLRDVRLERAAGRDGQSVIARVRAAQPELWAALEPCAEELLFDADLTAKKWDPDEDSKRDGFFFARPMTIAKLKTAPWKGFEGSQLVNQAVQILHADFEAIKAAENDFTAYKQRPGNTYETIHPVDGSYVRGSDERGHPFAALRMFFEADLPFPFSTYTCNLHILNRTDERGDYVCDIYSPSKDFLWMAGRDVFVPVRDSSGTWQGTLMVRLFGFDMKGVPDGDGDRRAALRAGAGALKREAQVIFARYGGAPRTIERTTPAFEVLGRK